MDISEHDYQTLSDATADLYKKGFVDQFEVENDELICRKTKEKFKAEELLIEDTYRFEGMTNPADNSIVYVISSKNGKVKGLIVNAYGTYSDESIDSLVKKIEIENKE